MITMAGIDPSQAHQVITLAGIDPGLVHTVRGTAANVGELVEACCLL